MSENPARTIDVLILGGGGREHALAQAIARSPMAGELWIAPGNGGTARIAHTAVLDPEDPREVAAFARDHAIDLVVIGPEAPLVAGVADAVRERGIAVFGPGAPGAAMEGSKAFAKEVMEAAGVPTAAWERFSDRDAALAHVREVGCPVVVKADGLAAGKGVVVAETLSEAEDAVEACFSGAFGEAGSTVVVEEMLRGPEVSLLTLTDGTHVMHLACAQDHKRALEGDRGPNTGGMGVYSPVPFVTDEEMAAMEEANERVVAELHRRGIDYRGCLYGGFMLTEEGPKVLEYNARFGDPETQVIVPRMEGDLLEVLMDCAHGRLDPDSMAWRDDWAVSVVMASGGYPGSYESDKAVTGITEAEALGDVTVYHAGTTMDDAGDLVTSGGRVLAVTALAPTFEGARDRAYEAVSLIHFDGAYFRRDIGARALRGRAGWEER